MIKTKQLYYWPIASNKKIIVQEVEETKVPKKEFKNIIKKEENLD